MERITSTYLHNLQRIYCDIGDRGICVDTQRVEVNIQRIDALIQQQLAIASNQWGCIVFVGAHNAPSKESGLLTDSVNLNATQGERALLNKLKNLGYNIPKITAKNSEGEYEQRFSTGELALQRMLVENKFNYPGSDPAIRAILKTRELGKIKSVYLCSRLFKRGNLYFFLCGYNVAGTLTGRRTSRKHTYGYGNNSQNFPKHSETSSYFRECLVPRPGNIFLFVDQVQAEEWPVSALSNNTSALAELKNGVDRHSALASKIFGENIPAKDSPLFVKSIHDFKRYLGKKLKHARNYGMKKKRMSESLAQEGFSVNEAMCEILLNKAAAADPSVDFVFHKYVQEQLSNHHLLVTPFGRERMFLACRPNADNNTVFNEAYSYIPQSVVGDNTGFTVASLDEGLADGLSSDFIVQEGHDSIVQDIPDSIESVLFHLRRIEKAFSRKIRFHNGIEIEIPIEPSIGYDFNEEVVIKTFDESGVRAAMEKLREKREKKREAEANAAAAFSISA
jgi:hypothetical protein